MKLEEGKLYLNKAQGLIGPMIASGYNDYPFHATVMGNTTFFTADGRSNSDSAFDLICEFRSGHQPGLSDNLAAALAEVNHLAQQMDIPRFGTFPDQIDQVMTKARAAAVMVQSGDNDAAITELLDMINSAVAAIITLRIDQR